jgi:phosphoenolpyruvate carboxylase
MLIFFTKEHISFVTFFEQIDNYEQAAEAMQTLLEIPVIVARRA